MGSVRGIDQCLRRVKLCHDAVDGIALHIMNLDPMNLDTDLAAYESRFLDSAESPASGQFCSARNDKYLKSATVSLTLDTALNTALDIAIAIIPSPRLRAEGCAFQRSKLRAAGAKTGTWWPGTFRWCRCKSSSPSVWGSTCPRKKSGSRGAG